MQFQSNQNWMFQETIPSRAKKKFDGKVGNFPT